MSRSRRNGSSSILKRIQKTSSKAIPAVDKGLKNVGMAAKGVAVKSAPIIEKGVSTVYGTLATGFDLGVKGAKGIASGVKGMTKKRRHSRRHKKSHRRH